MRNVTLAQIRTRARELADQSNVGRPFVSEVNLNSMINASIGQWHSFVLRATPERFEAEQTITADGSAFYALPDDYFGTMAVDYLNGNERVELRRAMFHERNDHGVAATSGQAEAYRLAGDSLYLLPAPTSGTYYHVYVTVAPVLTDANDTLDGINGWEQWIVYDVAIQLAGKEGTVGPWLLNQRKSIEMEMVKAGKQREMANAARVQDVRPAHLRSPGAGPQGHYDPDFWSGR